MKIDVKSVNNEKLKQIELPAQFNESFRPDVIKRAVDAMQANARQPYGAMPGAGMRHSAELSRRRRKYRGSYGIGISRVPRKIMSRRGTRMNWVGANAPGTVGGKKAHAPKADKIWSKDINEKERKLAIRSAIAASMNIEAIKERGHKIPKDYPFIVEDKIEKISKTKEMEKTLKALGLEDELKRTSVRKIRAGKGKSRGRRYITKKGPLVVVAEKANITRSLFNIPGIDITDTSNINAELLAPGGKAGRLTIWTEGAINKLGKERLYSK